MGRQSTKKIMITVYYGSKSRERGSPETNEFDVLHPPPQHHAHVLTAQFAGSSYLLEHLIMCEFCGNLQVTKASIS